MKFRFPLIMTVTLASVVACAQEYSVSEKGAATEHVTESMTSETVASGLELTEAVIQPPFPGRDVSAGFFTLQNQGAADRLIAARSSISDMVEIHTHLEEDGIMKMRRIEGVDVPEGANLVFKPGSYHLMMFNSAIPDDAYFANIILEFEKAGELTFTVPIDGRDVPSYGSDHSGADHGESGDDGADP